MDYASHLKELRESYYRSYPQQRFHIAKQRIENPAHGPNLIVTYVSAIEGILRSLVIWGNTSQGRPSEEIYKKYKNDNVKDLYKKYLSIKKCEPLVSSTIFDLVCYAVEYRNLLAHECTYLGKNKYPELIDACIVFLKAIADDARLDDS